jgi:hypothetical protein
VFFHRTGVLAGETFTLSLVLKGRALQAGCPAKPASPLNGVASDASGHDEVCLSRSAEANRSSSRRL